MRSYDYNKINMLYEGRFNEFGTFSIKKWIKEFNFCYLNAATVGFGNNEDVQGLYQIFLVVSKMINNLPKPFKTIEEGLAIIASFDSVEPYFGESVSLEDINSYWQHRVRLQCEEILRNIIVYAQDLKSKDSLCEEILAELATSSNDKVRLYCAGVIDDYIVYLNDSNERIKKVANIRLEFAERWLKIPRNKRRQILFLCEALKKGIIRRYDGLVGGPEDQVCARFESELFKPSGFIYDFDRDIFETILDKRILGDVLNEMILAGDLEFIEFRMPRYYTKKDFGVSKTFKQKKEGE